jgi:hypothetical protein
MRRLSAFKRIHAANPEARIPAFLRHPADIPDAMARMVAENEIRSDISPWEKGRLVVQAVDEEIFDTLDAAVNGLYPTLDRNAAPASARLPRSSTRSATACSPTPKPCRSSNSPASPPRSATGFGDLIEKALQQSEGPLTRGPVEDLRAILEEAEGEAREPPRLRVPPRPPPPDDPPPRRPLDSPREDARGLEPPLHRPRRHRPADGGHHGLRGTAIFGRALIAAWATTGFALTPIVIVIALGVSLAVAAIAVTMFAALVTAALILAQKRQEAIDAADRRGQARSAVLANCTAEQAHQCLSMPFTC